MEHGTWNNASWIFRFWTGILFRIFSGCKKTCGYQFTGLLPLLLTTSCSFKTSRSRILLVHQRFFIIRARQPSGPIEDPSLRMMCSCIGICNRCGHSSSGWWDNQEEEGWDDHTVLAVHSKAFDQQDDQTKTTRIVVLGASPQRIYGDLRRSFRAQPPADWGVSSTVAWIILLAIVVRLY